MWFTINISSKILSLKIIDFLLQDPSCHKSLILYSLIALEKFALTCEFICLLNILNCLIIIVIIIIIFFYFEIAKSKEKLLTTDIAQRIKVLEETYSDATDPTYQQIHFCSQWLLDNICKQSSL